MIFGYLQAKSEELCHLAFVNLDELAIFSGEHQWRWMAEIYKTKIAVRMHFAVEHGRDLTRMFLVADSECVASGDRLRQTQVDVLK